VIFKIIGVRQKMAFKGMKKKMSFIWMRKNWIAPITHRKHCLKH